MEVEKLSESQFKVSETKEVTYDVVELKVKRESALANIASYQEVINKYQAEVDEIDSLLVQAEKSGVQIK